MKSVFYARISQALPILLILLLLSCGKSNDPEPEPDLEKVTAYMIPVNNSGEPLRTAKYLWSEKEYNQEGQLIMEKYRKKSYSYSGHAIPENLFTEHNTYQNGLLTEQTIDRAEPPVQEKNVFYYTGNKKTAIDYYFGGSLIKKYTFEYTTGDKPSRMSQSDYNFLAEPTTYDYTYDSRGNKIREKVSSPPPYVGYPPKYPEGTITWEYDSYNNMTKETYYAERTKSTTVREIREYKYSPDGKMLEQLVSQGSDTWFKKHDYFYDSMGYLERIDISQTTNGKAGPYKPTGIIEYKYVFR